PEGRTSPSSNLAPRKFPQSLTVPELTRWTTVATTSESVRAYAETAVTRSSSVHSAGIVGSSLGGRPVASLTPLRPERGAGCRDGETRQNRARAVPPGRPPAPAGGP